MNVLALIRSDFAAQRRRNRRIAPFLFPHLVAAACFRIAAGLRGRRLPTVGAFVAACGQFLTGAELSPQAEIGPGLCLVHTGGVVIGPGVRAGRDLTVFSGVTIGSLMYDSRTGRPAGFPTLGDRVTIYTHGSVLGPYTLGDGATVGAHALVMSDGPASGVATGIPARWS